MSKENDATKVAQNEVANATNQRKTASVAVTIRAINVKKILGIMVDGYHVAKPTEELKQYPEESIVPKTSVELVFDGFIKKVVIKDGKATTVNTHLYELDMKRLVPRIVSVCDALIRHYSDLFDDVTLCRWLNGATLNIEQSYYQKDEMFEDCQICATQDCWHTVITGVTLTPDTLEEIKSVEEIDKSLFLERMMQRKREKLGLQSE